MKKRIYLTKFSQPEKLFALGQLPHDPFDHAGLKRLRAFTKIEKVIAPAKTDFDQAMAIAKFTSEAWGHNGFNSNPAKKDALTILKLASQGASFSCVQFGTVFVQLCHSVGIPARVIQVHTKNPGLGSSGQGHVTAEFFDNEKKKWIWVDPQIHAYASSYLSFTELSEKIVSGQKVKIKFTPRTLAYLKGNRADFARLERFVHRYVWISRVGGHRAFYTAQELSRTIGCKRKGVLPSLTFQGFADCSPEWLSPEEFDAPVNSCQIRFETLPPAKEVALNTLKEYRARAHLNFAGKKLRLHIQHNVPWFSHYEIEWNGKTKKVKSLVTDVTLKHGANILSLRAINKAKRKGPASTATVHFDSNYPAVKSFW